MSEKSKANSLKDLISSDLAHFLLKEDTEPESIKIEIHYKSSVARLDIDPEKIKKFIIQ